ncbi:hypothetical protein HC723_12255 [Vibrio sp. S11_S32]|uniref:hypothetical protein n=1 Tax=Vibrio sp. S11_S32 TaxID=2720225 RepID=UPI0016818A99|nr:hypothetical protein [Vibrio sp. S11_S32]MBD1577203.1 hypothetical protein [Vibrio sp. S11_S32]
MKMKLLAASAALAFAPTFANAAIDLNAGDTVSFNLSGVIEEYCVMEVVDDNAGGLQLENSVLNNFGSVKVWCNNGTGFADVNVTSANSGKLLGGTYGEEITYSFRFHENDHPLTTSANNYLIHRAGKPHILLTETSNIVTEIWTKKNAAGTHTLTELAAAPPIKQLYLQTEDVMATTVADTYADVLTLKIGPVGTL